jgi:hypothetical protein
MGLLSRPRLLAAVLLREIEDRMVEPVSPEAIERREALGAPASRAGALYHYAPMLPDDTAARKDLNAR